MRNRIVLLLFVLPCIIGAQSDSLSLEYAKSQMEKANKLRKQANHQEALLLCDSALMVFMQDSLMYDTLIADVYVEKGLSYWSLQRYEDCKQILLKGIDIYKRAYGDYSEVIIKPLTVTGIAYYYQGNNQVALHYYTKAKSVMDSIALEDDPYWPVLYTNIGNYYLNCYDVDNAYLFYSKALVLDEKKYDKFNLNILIDHFNLGTTYSIQSNCKMAISHYKETLNIFRNNMELDSFYWSMIQCNIGDCYFKMGIIDTAQQCFIQSLRPMIKKEGYNTFKSRVYKALGNCHFEKGEITQSLDFYNKSLVSARKKGGNIVDIAYDCHKHLATAYSELGQSEIALSLIDTAFATINLDENNPDFWNAPITKSTILQGVDAKTSILLKSYDLKGNETDLYEAFQTNKLSLDIIDSIKLDLKEKSSQQFVIDRFFSVYENAIDIQFELLHIDGDRSHIDQAFQIAEKSKSNLLLDAVLKSKALNFSDLPPEILEKETRIKNEITNTERQIHILRKNKTTLNELKLNELKHQLFDFRIAMQDLLSELETKYPKYYDLKYKSNSTDITTVQTKLLSEYSSLLEYFVGENHTYVLVINNKQSDFIKLGPTENIKPLVKRFCNMVSQFNPISTDMDKHCVDYTELAFSLYQQLIQPVELMLKEHVIVIPDGILTYLSFDALIGKIPANTWDIRNYDFLVKDYTFSYNYSADLMLEMEPNNISTSNNKLLAIAPSFETAYNGNRLRSGELSPLRYNIEEVEGLMTICDGKTLINTNASRNSFLQEAGEYKGIHFATHGKANDHSGAYSYLAFSQNSEVKGDENILFANDVYNLDLQAELVVLSACETGIGEWKRGEGMISLARAFSYAGVNHIVTTLWKVSDNKAAGLMQNYYVNLQQGMGKSTALRKAKLNYLAENNRAAAHPFYWASFISVGNDDLLLLDSPKNYRTLWILGGIILLAIVSFFFYKFIGRNE